MASYTIFWGCQIPARLPFAEKSTRVVLERLGVPITEIEGFTCCPERGMVRAADEDLWYAAAARNLALAEGKGLDILTPCNGCYSTQKEVIYQLKRSPYLKEQVNRTERALGLEYRGSIKVKHLVEFLHDEIGPGALRSRVKLPLAGLKIAVHPGCHLVRPYPAVNFDDPLNPVKFDAVVEALGAKAMAYSTKLLCCGQEYNAVDEPAKSAELPRLKLKELKELGAAALVTSCPTCYMQYDYKQAIMRRQGEDYAIPVFYLSELVALALGADPVELGLELHRTDVKPFFDQWQRARGRLAFSREHFDLTLVDKCYRCGGCLQDCPSHQIDPSWDPNAIMGRIVQGEAEELLDSPDIWQCIDCYICDEMCPQHWSMRIAFETLRHLALRQGKGPRGVRQAYETFARSGKLIEATQSQRGQRERLGLPPLFPAEAQAVERLRQALEGSGPQLPPRIEEPLLVPQDEEPAVDG